MITKFITIGKVPELIKEHFASGIQHHILNVSFIPSFARSETGFVGIFANY